MGRFSSGERSARGQGARKGRWAALVALVTTTLASLPGLAHADDDTQAAAETLFADARTLMAEKKYLQACPKLERSEKLDPQIGTEFNLARCYELGGQLASALLTYQRVIEETRAAGQEDREAVARRLEALLAPRVAHVVVRPPPGAAGNGLEIRCDGAVLEEKFWGEARPADPGTHVVDVTLPAAAPWRGTFVIDREGQRVDFKIPPLAWPSLASPLAPLPAAVETTLPPRARRQREIAAILGGVSLVGLGVGTYFGLRTASLASQARPYCDGGVCDQPGYGYLDEARRDGNIATVAFGAAASLLVGAAVLWLTAPRASAPVAGQ